MGVLGVGWVDVFEGSSEETGEHRSQILTDEIRITIFIEGH